MKTKNIFVFLLIILTQFSCKHKSPDLILSDYSCNLGRVNEGSICHGDITAYNNGDKKLFVNDIYPDCNCLEVSINKRAIEKKDSAIVHFSIDTSRKEGEIEHIITIEANTDSIIHFFTINAFVIKHNNENLQERT